MAIDFRPFRFFVEGKGDRAFIRDTLIILYGLEIKGTNKVEDLIIDCEGFRNLSSKQKFFKEVYEGRQREGGKNILIFDADFTGRENHHGFSGKMKFLENEKKNLGITFETFLFPNNKEDGTLETLLETCIHPGHANILECWNDLEKCIDGKGKYTIPANKSKIYFYLECLLGETNTEKEKIKDPNRNFLETDKWILDFTSNPYLQRLKTFFDSILL